MTDCTVEVTGPCTTPENAMGCQYEKPYQAGIPPLENLLARFVQAGGAGTNGWFRLDWDTAGADPNHNITFLYRTYEYTDHEFYDSPKREYRQSGIVVTQGTLEPPPTIAENELYWLMIRPETETHYGDWQRILALSELGWTSDAEIIFHRGVPVQHNGIYLFHTP